MSEFRNLAKEIVRVNTENGWDVPSMADWEGDNPLTIPTKLALIHSEVSEALEAFRHRDLDNFKEELADIVIRVASMAEGMGIDLNAEMRKKLEKNKLRGYKHGGKKV